MAETFLHVGCGAQTKQSLKGFNSDHWREIRFDINPDVNPDFIGSITDMSAVKSSTVNSVYSSHNIEHLFAHEVPVALSEFYRVLTPDGFAVITCPDAASVCQAVANGKFLEPLYESPAGPISAIDILWGHRAAIASGNDFMAHKCGFTIEALKSLLFEAGFKKILGGVRPDAFDIWVIAMKSDISGSEVQNLGKIFLP